MSHTTRFFKLIWQDVAELFWNFGPPALLVTIIVFGAFFGDAALFWIAAIVVSLAVLLLLGAVVVVTVGYFKDRWRETA